MITMGRLRRRKLRKDAHWAAVMCVRAAAKACEDILAAISGPHGSTLCLMQDAAAALGEIGMYFSELREECDRTACEEECRREEAAQ